MRRLVVVDMPAGDQFVASLQRTWDHGDAVLPLDQRLPPAARERVLTEMAPAALVDRDGVEHPLGDGIPVEDGDAVVIATSGTTGEPRGVVLTHAALAAAARLTTDRLGASTADHWLACLPLSHIGGFGVVTRALLGGTALTVQPSFDPAAVAAAAHEGATLVSLVPTALARIDPALFRWILLGGSRPPEDRPANVVATYGMTETGGGVVYDGVPLPEVDVYLDADGEIHVRAPTLLRCYRDGSDPKDAAGFLATGDHGHWRSDGHLEVLGRRGDMIVSGGENIWPDAVEKALRGLPGVADVAVAGVPDAEWGEIVTAWIVPANGHQTPSLSQLRDHVKQTLPAYAAPRDVHIVSELPRTTLGKVRRDLLRRAVLEQ